MLLEHVDSIVVYSYEVDPYKYQRDQTVISTVVRRQGRHKLSLLNTLLICGFSTTN